MTPEVFGELLLLDRLSHRSMTDAYLAVRLGDRSGKLLVVKRPRLGERASGAAAEALRREAEVLGERRWPGAVVLDASGDLAGLPYVAVEHVRGAALDRIALGGPLSEGAALLVGRDLARTLAALHDAGWVHGDVAPSNVIVDEAGDVTLVDFGLARREGEARDGPSGKPGYASPDAALGRPARRADDTFGWGAVVGECLAGRRLFEDRDLAAAAARDAELPPDVAAQTVVARALCRDATERPAASELAAISVEPSARSELAERARKVSDPREDAAPGTAPVPGAVVARAASAVEVARALEGKAAPAAAPRMRRAVVSALVLAMGLVGIVGFVAGRRTARRSATAEATLTLPALPARTRVSIDGRELLLAEAGRPIPIEPGKHTITVSLPREEREYDIVVEPGDHIVVVTLARTKQKAGKP